MAIIWIWDNWTTSLMLFCWFVAALGLKDRNNLDEGNVKARIRIAVGDKKIAEFTLTTTWPSSWNILTGKLALFRTNLFCLSTSDFSVHTMSRFLPQRLWCILVTNLGNVILEGKVPFELRPYFVGAKLIALKKPDVWLCLISVGDILRRFSAKCDGYHVFESQLVRYGSRQLVVGTKTGAELASDVFRSLIESLKLEKNVILQTLFENIFNSINRQFMLEKTFELHPDVLSTHTRRTVSRTRRSLVSSFGFGFHSGSDWQFGVESKPMLRWRWKFKWWFQNRFETFRKNSCCAKMLGFKIKLTKCELFPWWYHWKTTIDYCSIFPKAAPDQNIKERWFFHCWFTARHEIAGRRFEKENFWTGNI